MSKKILALVAVLCFFVSGFGTFAILKVASGDEKKSADSDKVLSEEDERPTSPDDPSSACPFGEPGTDYLSSTKNVRKINKYLRSVGRVGIFDAAKPDANAVLGFGVFKPLHVDMPPEKFDSYESMGQGRYSLGLEELNNKLLQPLFGVSFAEDSVSKLDWAEFSNGNIVVVDDPDVGWEGTPAVDKAIVGEDCTLRVEWAYVRGAGVSSMSLDRQLNLRASDVEHYSDVEHWTSVLGRGGVQGLPFKLVSQTVDTPIRGGSLRASAEPFYGVYVGAFKDFNNAWTAANDIGLQGYDLEIILSSDWESLNPENYYAVTYGCWDTQEEAEAALAEVVDVVPDAYISHSGAHR